MHGRRRHLASAGARLGLGRALTAATTTETWRTAGRGRGGERREKAEEEIRLGSMGTATAGAAHGLLLPRSHACLLLPFLISPNIIPPRLIRSAVHAVSIPSAPITSVHPPPSLCPSACSPQSQAHVPPVSTPDARVPVALPAPAHALPAVPHAGSAPGPPSLSLPPAGPALVAVRDTQPPSGLRVGTRDQLPCASSSRPAALPPPPHERWLQSPLARTRLSNLSPGPPQRAARSPRCTSTAFPYLTCPAVREGRRPVLSTALSISHL